MLSAKPIIRSTTWELKQEEKQFIYWPYFLLLCTVVSLVSFTWGYKQRQIRLANIDPTVIKAEEASNIANQYLKEAETALKKEDAKQFYKLVSTALLSYIGDKLNIGQSDLSKQYIRTQLTLNNVDEAELNAFTELLNKCEFALFAGGAASTN